MNNITQAKWLNSFQRILDSHIVPLNSRLDNVDVEASPPQAARSPENFQGTMAVVGGAGGMAGGAVGPVGGMGPGPGG